MTSAGSSIGTKSTKSNCIGKAAAQGLRGRVVKVPLPMPAGPTIVATRLLDKSQGRSQPGRQLATRVAEFSCFQDPAEP
jgi:hypothetical protein